jgi:hypothetical protein
LINKVFDGEVRSRRHHYELADGDHLYSNVLFSTADCSTSLLATKQTNLLHRRYGIPRDQCTSPRDDVINNVDLRPSETYKGEAKPLLWATSVFLFFSMDFHFQVLDDDA